MRRPRAGATDAPQGDVEGDDDERYESLRHPPRSDPDPSSSYSEYIDQAPRQGPQLGSKRGVVGSQAQRDPRPGPDRPRGQPPAGAEPDDVNARAAQPAGLRRYRGTERGFRAEPGPLARSGEPPAERSDESIDHDVRRVLEQDGFVEPDALEVEVEHGQVRLRGRVHGEQARLRAGNLVTSVAGVRRVSNELEVRGSGHAR